MKIKNEKEIYENLLKIEKELNLFEQQIDGLFFWKLIRLKVHITLLALSNNNIQKNIYAKSLEGRIVDIKNTVINSLLNSIFRDQKKVDVLFFENPRKVFNESNSYYDHYSFYYIEKFQKNSNLKYQIVDDGYIGKHFEKSSDKRKFTESIIYDLFYKVYLKLFFKIDNTKLMIDLDDKIFEYFGVKIDIKKILYDAIKMFKYQYKKYGKILDIKQPKEIYLVCSYGKEGMIQAAKERNIKVIEFQHGVMGKYQLGYSFPKDKVIPYFPDKLILFCRYWQDCTDLPIDDVEYFGYPHLTNKISKYQSVEKNDKQILIISQPSVSQELINYSLKLAHENPSFSFIYRLHPKEKSNWKNLYSELNDNSLKNYTVDDTEVDLYELIATSKFLVGVSSATIFESLVLDAKVIVLDINGVGHMDLLVENKNIMKIRINEKIDFNNLQHEFKTLDKNYLFNGYEND